MKSFVQKHFRYVYRLNDWGYGFTLGLGSLFPNGKAQQFLKPEILLGMGFEISWHFYLMNLGFDVGFPASIKKSFTYNGKNWETNVKHNYYTYYISNGFVMKETEFYKFTPNVGIAGIDMSVCEGDKDKVDGKLSMSQPAIKYGISIDIKKGIQRYFKKNIHSYSGFRIEFDYYQFLGNNPVMSGGMLRFRISLVGFMRSINRNM